MPDAATALNEAQKCLHAAAILADGYGKPETAAKFRAARDQLKEIEEEDMSEKRFLVLLREHPYVQELERVREAAAELLNSATGSGEEGFSRIPNDKMSPLVAALEASRGY